MVRYTLYGEGEGVLCESEQPVSVSTSQGVVRDATISARRLGVKPGMRIQTAQSLAPGLSICNANDAAHTTHGEHSSSTMQRVWEALWAFSPWLETVGHDAFFLQVPGTAPPVREVRNILKTVNALLSEEQRLRVGMAETPFLAKALVLWSRVERIRGAQYYKVGRQQWIVSPALASGNDANPSQANAAAWYLHMPVQCLWPLPTPTQTALKKLGVTRLTDFSAISSAQWKRHFGKEALQWSRYLHQEMGGSVRVNYPPLCYQERWQPSAGEEPDILEAGHLLETLVGALAGRLEKAGIGALKLKVAWETDTGKGAYERIAKRPAFQSDFLLVSLQPSLSEMNGRQLKALEILAEDVRPLAPVQSMFTVHNGSFVPVNEVGGAALHKLLVQVNRKFPQALQVGIRPKFRELRLQAVTELSLGASGQRA